MYMHVRAPGDDTLIREVCLFMCISVHPCLQVCMYTWAPCLPVSLPTGMTMPPGMCTYKLEYFRTSFILKCNHTYISTYNWVWSCPYASCTQLYLTTFKDNLILHLWEPSWNYVMYELHQPNFRKLCWLLQQDSREIGSQNLDGWMCVCLSGTFSGSTSQDTQQKYEELRRQVEHLTQEVEEAKKEVWLFSLLYCVHTSPVLLL